MKINIITQPLYCNYGGILQNYALQETLRSLGHSPLTINTPKKKPTGHVIWKDYIKTIINLYKKCRGDYELPYLSPYQCSLKEYDLSLPQRQFIEKYINKVDVIPPFSETVCKDYPADAWIVGSDQVWRPWCSPYIENCFFDFVNDNAIKIAYAASFGTDNWEISPDMTDKITDLAHEFKAISVRESSGVDLCRRYLGVHAEHLLDPTMLLDTDKYLGLTSENDYPHEKYIATYILDPNKGKLKNIKSVSDSLNLPVHPIGVMHKEKYDSVESWIATIANSEYVITDSFHGTVFSIIFNRPVKILNNDMRGNARLESLLHSLELKNIKDGFLFTDTDVQEKLIKLKEKSLNFITNSLS